MTAFLKLDRCRSCERETPWDWVPPLLLGAKPLAGTGVWRSALLDGVCAACRATIEASRQEERRVRLLRERLIQMLGGPKPYRAFTFDRYDVNQGNNAAFELAKRFDPARENLYVWGPCGVGKTHLAFAIARRHAWRGHSMALTTPFQLIRKLRMKTPEEEQQVLDGFIQADVFVLDDLGVGGDTPFLRQILQEILDGRDFKDRGGLIVTTRYSIATLARRMIDPAIASRLAGMCHVIEVQGRDGRIHRPSTHGLTPGTNDCTLEGD